MANWLAFLAALTETQAALRWWQEQRSLDLKQQAHQIREGLLQELFVLRRSLEADRADQHQTWLAQIEHIYQQLEQLGHDLSPAYLEESLPFAVQYALRTWQQRQPALDWAIDLPATWHDNCPHRSRLLLTTLDRLLPIATATSPKSLRVCLAARQQTGTLTVEAIYGEALAVDRCRIREVRYLEQCFRLLMPGACLHRRSGRGVTWYFYWRVHSESTPRR